MKTALKILLGLIILLVLIQLIPTDTTNPPVKKEQNFADIYHPDGKVLNLLQHACYDCHSFETKYPSYASWAPVSWSVRHHINEGREHGNFSAWTAMTPEGQQSFLEKSIEEIREKEMPMPGYIAWHPEANLTSAERQVLINYFETVLKTYRK